MNKKKYSTNIPYLVTVSGRQEDCVGKVLSKLESQPLDAELIGLLHNIFETNTPNHTSRGFTILDVSDKDETVCLAKSVSHFSGEDRPVCFMYSGMGSQWPGMGTVLMQLPTFKKAIMRCHEILSPKGIDIVKIVTDNDKHIFDNVLHCFVGIAAVQIGLTDILKELGIVPDIMIGHSLGEMGCAYADGCFTADETILTSYSRGLASIETEFIHGAMAAVGMGYENLVKRVTPEIDIACHNSSESSTISGPAEAVAKFVKELQEDGIFAKEVPSCGISYHSRYTAVAGPKLLSCLQEVIKTPKQRSNKWLCTSIPKEKWNDPIAKYSSPEFHVNNLLSPVYFEETSTLIPENAVIIEIAPHGLLQAILRRSHSNCTNIPLTKRGTDDPIKFLLQAFGKIYETGVNFKISELYPKIEFPVSTETPFLSHFVEWEHSENWPVVKPIKKKTVTTGIREFGMSIYDDDYSFIKGHVRNGLNVFPESGLLVLVWETLAMTIGSNYKHLSVTFKNIKFHGEVVIDPNEYLNLTISIHKISNMFEVFEKKLIVTGFISHSTKNLENKPYHTVVENNLTLNSHDIYKMLHQHGYSLKDKFQSINSASMDYHEGTLIWNDNWTTLIDGIIKLNILANGSKGMLTPKLIQELKINVSDTKTNKKFKNGNVFLDVNIQKLNGITRCGGLRLTNIVFENRQIIPKDPDVLNNKVFYPHFPRDMYDLQTALHLHLQIINENISKGNIRMLFNPGFKTSLMSDIEICIKNIDAHIECMQIKEQDDYAYVQDDNTTSDVFVVNDFITDGKNTTRFYSQLKIKNFVLALQKFSDTKEIPINKHLSVISAVRINNDSTLILLKKVYSECGRVSLIKIDNNHKWLKQMYVDLASKKNVILLSENQPYSGITGIVRFMSKEYGNRITSVVINDIHAAPFDQEDIFYKEQFKKQLVVNILQKGVWGGFYSIPHTQISESDNNYALDISSPVDSGSFKWCEIPNTIISPTTVKVQYAGLSVNDVNIAKESNGRKFGMDFSGVDINGNRVMGLIEEGAIAKTVVADPDLLWPVPEYWTMKEAATVPLAYAHAYYCLTVRMKLYNKTIIIVTGGAGALGQAVISLCLASGHDVYATVGDIEKKKLLMTLFPALKEYQIYTSRDAYFADLIRNNLKGKYRNVVINCCSGYIRQAFMKCVGETGFFLDVCQKDMKENENIGMRFIDDERNYVAVNLSNIFRPENEAERKLLQHKIREGIAKGIVRPLTCVEYNTADVSRAFRLIASRKHRGKVLINLQSLNKERLSKLTPRIICSSETSFIIICDKHELGIEIAELLVNRGAKKIFLHLMKNKISGYGKSKLALCTQEGANIQLVSDNVETEEGCSNVLNEAVQMGPVEGIFIINNEQEINAKMNDEKDYAEAIKKLTSVVTNFDATSRYIIKDTLRYFAVITKSSKNIFDEYLNSVSEEICRVRRAEGLPGLFFHAKCVDQFSTTLESQNQKIRPQDVSTLCRGLEISLKLNLNSTETINIQEENKSGLLDSTSFNNKSQYMDGEESIKCNDSNKDASLIRYSSDDHEDDNLKPKTNFNLGLGAFYTFVDDDLYRATNPFIQMSTKVNNLFESEFEVDPHATYLMLIPGFEGHHQIFKSLCIRLKIKAFTIQLDPDMKTDSIQEMAGYIFKLLKKKLVLNKKFYLLGYSFGVNIALELTSMLEKEGHIGIVYCLDSSPDILRKQMDSYIGPLSDIQLQNVIIDYMYNLLTGNKIVEPSNDIKASNDWVKKMEYFIYEAKKTVSHPHQYMRCLLDSAYRRIILARNYNPTYILNSEIILMKGIAHPDSEKLPYDYNLSKYSTCPVKIFEIEADITSAPYNCQVTNIIHKMLDPELLTEFMNSSSCVKYFLDDKRG